MARAEHMAALFSFELLWCIYRGKKKTNLEGKVCCVKCEHGQRCSVKITIVIKSSCEYYLISVVISRSVYGGY